MITKFTLTSDGIERDVTDCLKNWEDVLCAYKRTDFGGVVRSFTSAFDFALEAAELLMSLYRRDRFKANALLRVYTQNNSFGFDKRFECELDFSTIAYSEGVVSINAIDDSVAAKIKAGKSTKYEFKVGEDIRADGTFNYDRMPMLETVTYAFTMGESDPQTGAITCTYEPPEDGSRMMWVGSVADETTVGGTVFWNDDQENSKAGFMILALKDCEVKVEASVVNDRRVGDKELQVYVRVIDSDGNAKSVDRIFTVGWAGMECLGEFASASALEAQHPSASYPTDKGGHVWATVQGIAYALEYNGHRCVWTDTEKEPDEYFRAPDGGEAVLSLSSGDKAQVISIDKAGSFKVLSSSVRLSWRAVGDTVGIPYLKPQTVAEALLVRICDRSLNFKAVMGETDARLADTVVLPAECVRGISGAKLYTSFSEFSDFMGAVFGYAYCLGGMKPSEFAQSPKLAGYSDGAAYPISTTPYYGEVDTARICYCNSYGKFLYAAEDGTHYDMWPTSAEYNAANRARTDTVFIIGGAAKYFTAASNEPKRYEGDHALSCLPVQEVRFVHRSELFSADAPVRVITESRDLSFTPDSSRIFSSVEAGYAAKEYDSVNGRDEWNFSSEYSTGCSVSDKKLSLISKYRADCYGIEFACQKRGKDSTDSGSDKDVFFALGEKSGASSYVPDRARYPVEGALSDKVFNGAFCPRKCIEANAGFIGMQANPLAMKFASSTGNTAVAIGGTPADSDIVLDSPLMMGDKVEFTTSDMREPQAGEIIEVSERGLTCRGFISEVEIAFAKEETVKYRLHLKEFAE